MATGRTTGWFLAATALTLLVTFDQAGARAQTWSASGATSAGHPQSVTGDANSWQSQAAATDDGAMPSAAVPEFKSFDSRQSVDCETSQIIQASASFDVDADDNIERLRRRFLETDRSTEGELHPVGFGGAELKQVPDEPGPQTEFDPANTKSVQAASLTLETSSTGSAPFLDLTSESPADATGPGLPSDALEPVRFSSEQMITALIWLLVLTCLMILFILGLRRFQRSRGLLPAGTGKSRVVETLSLGPGRTVSLIEINGLRALVGADSGGIRSIVVAPQTFDEELSDVNDVTGITLMEA